MSKWTFLSNHTHVLYLICSDNDLLMKDIASLVNITERAVQRIIHDLVAEGYLVIQKEGRRNHYEPQLHKNLRHPLEENITIGELMAGLQSTSTKK